MLNRLPGEQSDRFPLPVMAREIRQRRSGNELDAVVPRSLPGQGGHGVVRDINRRVVLNLIRAHQPISRAEIARLCGLQRSTVSQIVEQLMEESWVSEATSGRLPIGRQPVFFRLGNNCVIVGVDVRPGQTTVTAADVDGKFIARDVIAKPLERAVAADEILQSIWRVRDCCDGRKVVGIGISLPGPLDEAATSARSAPGAPWSGLDLAVPIMRATGVEVELETGANACVLAARWFHRLEACRNLAVIAVSDVISTGILIDGQLVRGSGGMAGEFAHVSLDPNGPLCRCGGRGCWEVYASNRAAVRAYMESGPAAPDICFNDLLCLAEHGDNRAAAALGSMASYLGRGMRMIVAGLAPERIVVVGDLTLSWNRVFKVIKAESCNRSARSPLTTRIDAFGDFGLARLRGAVALVLQKEFGDYVRPSFQK